MILLYVLIACLVLFLLSAVIIRLMVGNRYRNDEKKAIAVSRSIYKLLTRPQKYAIVFLLDAFKDSVRTGVTDLAAAIHQVEIEARAMDVSVKEADEFFKAEGSQEGIMHVSRLLDEVKEAYPDIVDFLMYRCHYFVSRAGGSNRQIGMPNEMVAQRLFKQIYTHLGYSEKEIESIISNPQNLIRKFGRYYLEIGNF